MDVMVLTKHSHERDLLSPLPVLLEASYTGPAHTQREGIAHRSGCPEAGIIRHFIVSFYLSFPRTRKRKHSFSIINRDTII